MAHPEKVMSERERRNELAKRIYKLLATAPFDLDVQAKDGSFPFVVALEHELLSEVMQRVQSSGGSATTFVEFDTGRIAYLAIRSTRDHGVPDGAENLGPEPIHEDIDMGMMVLVTERYKDGVVVPVDLPMHEGEVESSTRGELVSA